jgi:hypothetical protein
MLNLPNVLFRDQQILNLRKNIDANLGHQEKDLASIFLNTDMWIPHLHATFYCENGRQVALSSSMRRHISASMH